MSTRGGKREGSGRKPKSPEEIAKKRSYRANESVYDGIKAAADYFKESITECIINSILYRYNIESGRDTK